MSDDCNLCGVDNDDCLDNNDEDKQNADDDEDKEGDDEGDSKPWNVMLKTRRRLLQ